MDRYLVPYEFVDSSAALQKHQRSDPVLSNVEEEISPLLYARASGLSRDYLADTSALQELEKLRQSVPDLLSDDSHLRSLHLSLEVQLAEQWTVSREAEVLIEVVTANICSKHVKIPTIDQVKGERRGKKLKLELPLLRTDHEKDQAAFACREGFEVKLRDIRFPLEVISDEDNGGLIWPTRYQSLGSHAMEELKKEKMPATKEIILYLSGCIGNTWTQKDDQTLWDSQEKYHKRDDLTHVTPPLTPRLSPYKPFKPSMSDPVFQIPLLSDPISPTKHELDQVEQKLYQEDVPALLRESSGVHNLAYVQTKTDNHEGCVKLGDIYSPLADLDDFPGFFDTEMHRVKRENLKVDEILTPNGPDVVVPKTVKFSEVIEEMELELDLPSAMNSADFESKFFEDAFGPAYEKMTRQSEQEGLLEADVTARVDVPVMDFTKADPPWKRFENSSDPTAKLNLQKSFMRETIGANHSKWAGAKRSEHKLKWNPFPKNLDKTGLEETLESDDHNYRKFLTEKTEGNDLIDSLSIIWKPEGLRILKDREEEEDEELDHYQFLQVPRQDISSLVRKRKLRMEDVDRQDDPIVPAAGPSRTVSTQIADPEFVKGKAERNSRAGSILGEDAFSAMTSLDHFLELRGMKKPKLIERASSIGNTSQVTGSQGIVQRLPEQVCQAREVVEVVKAAALPIPQVGRDVPSTQIIIASTILRRRSLVRSMEHHLPNLTLVERDFSIHKTLAWMPGSVTRSPIASPLAAEADIIVSPSAGIMITTLQKIKQKPLPGQKATSEIRERLGQVSIRYEKLVVFVCEGRSDETSDGFEEVDCIAYAEFISFALSLDTAVSVQFVGGGEATLSKWLVSTIVQHGVDSRMDLLAEETHWELFLRRAGMNAMAAQAIIAELKSPAGVDLSSPSKKGIFGLSAFVEMEKEERLSRFGWICGSRVLERASTVIDVRWAAPI